MSKTIDGVPEYFTREQYVSVFEAIGLDPKDVTELRAAGDGFHVRIKAKGPDGQRLYDVPRTRASEKFAYPRMHSIFIPVRDEPDDHRTTRIRPVTNQE